METVSPIASKNTALIDDYSSVLKQLALLFDEKVVEGCTNLETQVADVLMESGFLQVERHLVSYGKTKMGIDTYMVCDPGRV